MFIKLYAVLAAVVEVAVVFFTEIISGPKDFWIPILLYIGFFVGLLALHMIILLVISLFVNKNKPCEKPSKFFKFLTDYTVEAVLTVARVKIEISGVEKIPTGQRFLLVSNHRSNFDPFICISKLRKYGLAFVSKPENFKIIVAGAFIHKCCFLPIDRENPRNAMRTIRKATDFVKDDICSIGIYPEGTRSRTGELLEFKDGVFYIAKKAPCPIVVATTENTEKIGKNFPLHGTTVKFNVLDVIYPESFADKSTHEISEQVRDLMLASLGK